MDALLGQALREARVRNHRMSGLTGAVRRLTAGAILSCWLVPSVLVRPATAQEAEAQQQIYDAGASTRDGGVTAASIANSLPSKGDPYGLRRAFADRGFTLDAIYTGEFLRNVSGGIRRGGLYGGKLELDVAADLEKALGLTGLSFYTNGFQIHQSKGISKNFVGNLNTISAIEAIPATRLSELWLEQKLFGGLMSIRAGQLAADTEFTVSNYSLPFITSDWPAILANNLPGGGPAYPLSTPGIRVKFDPNPQASFLFGAYNGDPAGPGLDPEIRNRTGTNFRLKDRALLMAETQYRYNQADRDAGLAGFVRFGIWHHLGKFDDRFFDPNGVALSSSGSTGKAASLKNNGGVYGIVDQQIYRPEGGDANDGVTVFARAFANPSDRNLVRWYLDGGVVFTGFVPDRPKDRVGLTFLYTPLSLDVIANDRLVSAAAGLYRPRDHSELSLELTYVAEIRTGWTIQPNVHRIVNPGGNRARINPYTGAVGPPLKDATVVGLRTTIVY